ncbi:LTA synthase family protein [Zoogloea sp.]|uniref:LTA synthase family protein n=1 Tax=Zoogloea sp. TaxID=49181 RepID=UPI0035B16CA9
MTLLLALLAGQVLSMASLGALHPVGVAPWRWQARGWALHGGLFLALQALLTLVLGRPWFALALALALLMLVIQVSNAKYQALREIFVFQDFEYFTDAIRHPRLYIPFLGWWKFALIACCVLAALAVGLWLEPAARGGVSGPALGALVGAGLLIYTASGKKATQPPPSWQPEVDLARVGLLASLWDYAWAERQPLAPAPHWCTAQPFAGQPNPPDLVVIQSESFFDPRTLYPGIRPEVLAGFDACCAQARQSGRLDVPAWGANTVRSEFAFLSGLPEAALGVHRFNPYRWLARQTGKAEGQSHFPNLVSALKAAGYRTICIHPYPASFYQRDRVFPLLGFDRFIDLAELGEAPRSGPYVGDLALLPVIRQVLAESPQPALIFVITMENHGPLHLEQVAPGDEDALYQTPPAPGCADLTIYLRHLRNASQFAGDLTAALATHPRPARLAWYGDHVPIMPQVYQTYGLPPARTDYFVWDNPLVQKAWGGKTEGRVDLAVEQLGKALWALGGE